jgi:hypothetical protein
MKELKTKKMKELLSRGVRKTYKIKHTPSDETFINLIYKTMKNGWHYQVEYLKDSRFYTKPRVIVYAFKPPFTIWARSADYYLFQEVKDK